MAELDLNVSLRHILLTYLFKNSRCYLPKVSRSLFNNVASSVLHYVSLGEIREC